MGEKERLEEAERRIGTLMDDREVMFKRLKALEDKAATATVAAPVPAPYQDPNTVECIRCGRFHKNRHETCQNNVNGLWECKGGCK